MEPSLREGQCARCWADGKNGILEKDLGRLPSSSTKTRNKAAERIQERHDKRQWLWVGVRGVGLALSLLTEP